MDNRMFFEENVTLENGRARLEPLAERHFSALNEIAANKDLWTFTSAKINSTSDFRRYFDQAIFERKNLSSYPYAIFDKKLKRYAGCTRFGNINLPHKRVEIGWTWYDPMLQRTGLNRNCKFLMLNYGFEALHLNRIELKTSSTNLRSQKAIKQIGAVKEGILRRHMINEYGEVRDTVYYSFISDDWPSVRSTIFKEYF